MRRAAEFSAHFTAAKLASRIGVTESAYLRWERGDTRPTKLHVQKLAKELGVTVEDLGLDGEGADA